MKIMLVLFAVLNTFTFLAQSVLCVWHARILAPSQAWGSHNGFLVASVFFAGFSFLLVIVPLVAAIPEASDKEEKEEE